MYDILMWNRGRFHCSLLIIPYLLKKTAWSLRYASFLAVTLYVIAKKS